MIKGLAVFSFSVIAFYAGGKKFDSFHSKGYPQI